jgi:RNA polymerase sigma-70 factor (ECF subfamily)
VPEENINNDSDLLLLVAGGNHTAFKRLVDLYWNKVYGNTLALTKSPQVAEELTQDIFVKVWNQRENLAEVENFSVYIYVIGRNQVLSALRRKIVDTSSEVPGNMPEDIHLPDAQLEMKDTYRIILEGIELLPSTRKKVFKLSRIANLSYDEIAAELGISKNTVKEHIVNALNFLRNYIHSQTGRSLLFLILVIIMGFFHK